MAFTDSEEVAGKRRDRTEESNIGAKHLSGKACQECLVTSDRPGCAGTDWTSVVFAVSARECLVDAGFDIAFGLPADRCQL